MNKSWVEYSECRLKGDLKTFFSMALETILKVYEHTVYHFLPRVKIYTSVVTIKVQ